MDIKIEHARAEPSRNPGARKSSIRSVNSAETTPAQAGRLAGPIIFGVQHLPLGYPSAGVWLPNGQPQAVRAILDNSELIIREIKARCQFAYFPGARLAGSYKSTANPPNLSTTSFIAIKI